MERNGLLGLAASVAALLSACGAPGSGDDDGTCRTNADCPGGVCIDNRCRRTDGGGEWGADADVARDGEPDGTVGEDGFGGPEVCGDGLDNDLDGQVDEDCGCIPGATQTCYSGPPGAAGVGICARGTQTCEGSGEFGAWSDCVGSGMPGAETCGDGTDDDCDGSADEACACDPGERRTCYTGPAGTAGVGICRPGTQACVEVEGGGGSTWGDCWGQTLPGSDVCDGLDNDCDGAVDQGCGCPPDGVRSCYEGPSGARGRGICVDGSQDCVVDPGGLLSDWAPCTGWVGPATEICGDGLDNDCDGMTDEGCGCLLGDRRSCYTGPAGTEGVGTCRPGTQPCVAVAGGGTEWGACTGSVVPTSDVCDGLDNDCDGVRDELCLCAPGAMEGCYDGPAGTRGRGICLDGLHECVAGPGGTSASWGPCEGWTGPGTEVCDTIDNDCDGTIDEGCICTRGTTRSCYSGPAGTSGVGMCRPGTQTCIEVRPGESGWGACSGEVLPATEVCGDARDNDCDGLTDESCACIPGTTRSCYSGPAGTSGVGICRSGSQSCVEIPGGGSTWTACTGEIVPAVETCNGLDDDCDRSTDEGCLCTPGTTRACYSGPASTRGVGECRDGSQVCVEVPGSGSDWGACTGERLPSAEVCGNGRDEDCDGVPDDGCVTPPPCVTCPASPITMVARTTVTLSTSDCGSGSPIVSHLWEVVSGPPGAIYSFGCASCASTSFRADIAGTYTVRHTVTDSLGRTATCTVTINVTGLGLRVEVTWTSSTADIDTHLLNGAGSVWATSSSDSGDCHWRNCRPSLSWPPAGTDGDSRLDIDDVDGYGPENINVDVVNIGESYRVGIHWWSGHGDTTSGVTVRIFCGDISATPVRTFTRTLRGTGSGADAANDLWKVADVRFTDPDNCTVTSIDSVVPSGPGNIGR